LGFAASYNAALRSRSTLLPFVLVLQPAWSIKIDEHDSLWIAGTRGIFKFRGDSLILFNRMGEVHDIAFVGKELAVAHKNGISVFNKETGELLREFCKGVICWTITNYASLLIGGGKNVCVVIGKDGCRTVAFGPEGNMAWSVAMDSAGTLYLATQKGLYRADKGRTTARLIGFKNTCIKSLLIDTKGRLWIGRFSKDKNP
jgi:ligand-binding sensor domain-containing protein